MFPTSSSTGRPGSWPAPPRGQAGPITAELTQQPGTPPDGRHGLTLDESIHSFVTNESRIRDYMRTPDVNTRTNAYFPALGKHGQPLISQGDCARITNINHPFPLDVPQTFNVHQGLFHGGHQGTGLLVWHLQVPCAQTPLNPQRTVPGGVTGQ